MGQVKGLSLQAVSFLHESVAESVDSLNLYACAGFGKFLPEILHLCIKELEIVGLVYGVAPDSFRKHSLVHDMFRALDEILQNVELFLQQQDILPRYLHPPRIRL